MLEANRLAPWGAVCAGAGLGDLTCSCSFEASPRLIGHAPSSGLPNPALTLALDPRPEHYPNLNLDRNPDLKLDGTLTVTLTLT